MPPSVSKMNYLLSPIQFLHFSIYRQSAIVKALSVLNLSIRQYGDVTEAPSNILQNVEKITSYRCAAKEILKASIRIFHPPGNALLVHQHQLKRPFSLSSSLHKHRKKPTAEEVVSDLTEGDLDDDIFKNQEIIKEIYKVPGHGARVFVVQPDIKWGPRRNPLTTSQLQLNEAIALTETLPGWTVVQKEIFSTKVPQKKTIFGRGNYELLIKKVRSLSDVTAVFVNVEHLSAIQHTELEDALGVPVYDRYMVVLQIFLEHARTKEAKLQIALAEIPYLRSRLHEIHKGKLEHPSGKAMYVGGSGETFIETRQRLLRERELKIKKALEKVKSKRQLLRQNRIKKEIPTVAVIGYTNAGKTALIKALTGEDKLQPEDKLFATLDVTAHSGALKNHMNVLFIDTIGFISDIPTTLIDSFQATLEDVVQADLLIHVRDISHPDSSAQKQNVINTLMTFDLPDRLLDNMIEVCNKCDLHPGEVADADEDALMVSSLKGTGISSLMDLIEVKVLQSTAKMLKTFHVPNGGEELQWLYKESSVESVEEHRDPELLTIHAVISDSALSKFTAKFGSSYFT